MVAGTHIVPANSSGVPRSGMGACLMGQVGPCSGASIQAPDCGGPATPRATDLYCFKSSFLSVAGIQERTSRLQTRPKRIEVVDSTLLTTGSRSWARYRHLRGSQ